MLKYVLYLTKYLTMKTLVSAITACFFIALLPTGLFSQTSQSAHWIHIEEVNFDKAGPNTRFALYDSLPGDSCQVYFFKETRAASQRPSSGADARITALYPKTIVADMGEITAAVALLYADDSYIINNGKKVYYSLMIPKSALEKIRQSPASARSYVQDLNARIEKMRRKQN